MTALSLIFQVLLWREDSPGRWTKLYEYTNHDSSVNSVAWAPHEFGLILACGSSDGAISIVTYTDTANQWECEKLPNAHTIGKAPSSLLVRLPHWISYNFIR